MTLFIDFYYRFIIKSLLFAMTLNDPRVMTLTRVKKGQKMAKVDPP
jgi:hypothetical protein